MANGDLSPQLVREARKGRLVVFVGAELPAGDLEQKIRLLPCSLWVTENPCGNGRPQWTASQIEEGTATEVQAGSVVVIDTPQLLGTPRRPARLLVWLEEILRRRTALLVGTGSFIAAIRQLSAPSFDRRHFVAPPEQTEQFLDQLLEQARGAAVAPLPPLPAVASPWGLATLATAAAVAVASWLMLYLSHGGAQNWRWLRLAPGALVVLALGCGLLPWLSNAAAGRELPASECYARALARWSRPVREPLAVALLLLLVAGAWWLGVRYVPATFLVLDEAVGVTANERPVGACRAEEPCALIVPQDAHLHFDGAEGACAMELSPEGGMIIINLQNEACEPYPEENAAPSPRGG